MAGKKQELEEKNMLSAVPKIPQTLLFGRSPSGLNSTGESDLENWYSSVEHIQKMNLKRNLRTVIDTVFMAGVASGELSETPKYKLTFKPLWSLSEAEQATVEQTKAATAQTKAATAQVYVDMGALDPSEVRKGLASNDDFNVEDIITEDDPFDELLDSLVDRDTAAKAEGMKRNAEQEKTPGGKAQASENNSLTPENHRDMIEKSPNISLQSTVEKHRINIDGGPGSGNFGHAGVPGQVGGSAPEGGASKQSLREKYSSRLIGQTTSDGIEIKAISDHAFSRISTRKISAKRIENMLKSENISPDKTFPDRRCYDVKGSRLVLEHTTGTIVTVEWRKKNK